MASSKNSPISLTAAGSAAGNQDPVLAAVPRTGRGFGRRAMLALMGLGSVAAGMAGTVRRSTGAPVVPRPAPSFTTTAGAPRVVAAHAGLLTPGLSDPQPGPQRMQVAVHTTEPCAVKVQVDGGDAGSFESDWTVTAVGADAGNPVNVAKTLLPEGCAATGVAWTWKVLLAPAATAADAPASAAVAVDSVTRQLPVRPAPGLRSRFRVATGSCSQVAHPGQKIRPRD